MVCRWTAGYWRTACLFVVMAISAIQGQDAMAQPLPGGRASSYPAQQYYLALEVYRSGDLPTALEAFDAALGQSRLDGTGRWIDSIPALAMLGECHYQLGNLPMAMVNIEAALQLTVRHRGWLSRVDFSTALMDGIRQPDSQSGWAGASNLRMLPIASRMPVQRGEVITEQRVNQGGSIEPLNVVSMDVAEIMRGIAIALHRRRIIMGEMSKDSGIAAEVLEATKYPQDLQIPIGRTLIGSIRATGQYADMDNARVVAEAPTASTLGGGIHPLTPIVLLCYAETLADSARPIDAVPVALNAAQTAAALGHHEWIGEALQLALGCSEPAGVPAIRNSATSAAGVYARSAKATTLAALLVASEAAILSGERDASVTLLQQAQTISGRRGFLHPRLTAYGAYVSALSSAFSGQTLDGPAATTTNVSLTAIRNFTFNNRIRNKVVASNPSVYQLGGLIAGTRMGALDQRSEQRLRYFTDTPPDAMWRRDPVEALGWLMNDRSLAQQSLLASAAESSDPKKILSETDLTLRRAFADQLPLSGRLQQVRTLATVDATRLNKTGADFLKKPPAQILSLRESGAALQQAAAAGPLAMDALRAVQSQAAVATLMRSRYPEVMLPALELDDLKRLPPRTGMLVFTLVNNRVLATLASSNSIVSWLVGDASQVHNSIGKLLKEIGVGQTRASKLENGDAWKTFAAEFGRQLLAETSFDSKRFDELIVVPAGSLWYLPLEIIPAGGEDAPLIGSQLRIRYAPTPGLALQSTALAKLPFDGASEAGDTAINAGLFFAPRDATGNQAAVQSLVDVSGATVRLPLSPLVPSGLLSPSVQRLVIAAPRAIDPTRSLQFSLVEEDNGVFEGTLAGWLALPNHSPTSVVLPGLRTTLASGRLGDGSELFMAVMTLHVSGVRDVLLSRWAIGGQSTTIAMRELLQELPHIGMQAAWNRALLLLQQAELDPENEPLLGNADKDAAMLTGEPPLFWASYLMSTTGMAAKP